MASFVLDENLPRLLADRLRDSGHEAWRVRDEGLSGAADLAVLDLARSRRAILISADLDFANTLAFPLGSHSGIVVLRTPERVGYRAVVVRVLSAMTDELLSSMNGSLAIVDMTSVRIRRP
jgi:predicted nuclease of predicted toxin-antitoxin system